VSAPHPIPGSLATPAVLAIIALTYIGIAVGRVPGLKLNRTGIALLGAISIAIFSGLPTDRVVGFINWPTILLLFGFFVISAQLRLSGFFDWAAGRISASLDNPRGFMLSLMLASAGMSAFLNHDVVCFVFAPVAATALLRRRLNPVPFLVALALASNLGAAATIVGNSQDMLIAQTAGLGFGAYALWCVPPVLFALACGYALIWALSRGKLALPAEGPDPDPAANGPAPQPLDRAHTIKGLVILAVVIGFFFSGIPKEIIALAAAAIHIASPKFKTEDLLGRIDWSLLVLFMGLFVVTGAFQATGYGDQAVRWLAGAGFNLQSPPVLAVATAALSNIIGNAAAVMLLVKAANLAHAPAAYVLALSNSFGGGLIILGSVSNIIVVQQAREMGINISFWNFARLGVPVTLAAMAGLLGWVALVA
jgi:Na+/H+ antiporter NhaD/arsenite permease-like protein